MHSSIYSYVVLTYENRREQLREPIDVSVPLIPLIGTIRSEVDASVAAGARESSRPTSGELFDECSPCRQVDRVKSFSKDAVRPLMPHPTTDAPTDAFLWDTFIVSP